MKHSVQILLVIVVIVLVSSMVVASDVRMVDMEFRDAPLVDVFQVLGELGGLNVLVDPSVTGTVSFYLKDLGVQEALDLVSRTTGFRYRIVGNTLIVATEKRLQEEFSSEDFAFVYLKNADVNSAGQLVKMVVPSVRIYSDNDRNLLVIYGTTTDIELAQSLLRQYDGSYTPVSTVESTHESQDLGDQESLQVFSVVLRYADGTHIMSMIQQMFPRRDIVWNEMTRLLTVTVTPEEWLRISDIVTKHDVPAFTLRGVVSSGERQLALVEYKKGTRLLEVGDVFHEWIVEEIEQSEVTFKQGDRSFVVRLGR